MKIRKINKRLPNESIENKNFKSGIQWQVCKEPLSSKNIKIDKYNNLTINLTLHHSQFNERYEVILSQKEILTIFHTYKITQAKEK